MTKKTCADPDAMACGDGLMGMRHGPVSIRCVKTHNRRPELFRYIKFKIFGRRAHATLLQRSRNTYISKKWGGCFVWCALLDEEARVSSEQRQPSTAQRAREKAALAVLHATVISIVVHYRSNVEQ